MDNFRVVKVVETKVTVYTIKGDHPQDVAEELIELCHAGGDSENPKINQLLGHIRLNDGIVTMISSTSDFKAKTEYSLKNDSPTK